LRNYEKESANEHDLRGALTFHNEAHVQLLLATHVHLKLAGVHALRLSVRSDAIGIDMSTKGGLCNVDCFVEREVLVGHLVVTPLLRCSVYM